LALPHHRHEWGVALHQLPPNSTTLPLSSSKAQRNDFPVVRFAPSPLRVTPAAVPEHRPWHFATPFIPHHAGSPPADFTGDDYAEVFMPSVDMEPSRRLAYAFVEPACADPGLFIRLAL
jgi:hypothetical protein